MTDPSTDTAAPSRFAADVAAGLRCSHERLWVDNCFSCPRDGSRERPQTTEEQVRAHPDSAALNVRLSALEILLQIGKRHPEMKRVRLMDVEVEFYDDQPAKPVAPAAAPVAPEPLPAAAVEALPIDALVPPEEQCPCSCAPWEHTANVCLNGHPESLCRSKHNEDAEDPE